MNAHREARTARPDDPADASGGRDDALLLPYRNWALQSNLVSVFDTGSTWRDRPSELGLAEDESEGQQRGQCELLRELEPDPELSLRTKTSLMLWATALFTDVINQVGPIGIKMSSGAFAITIAGVIAAMVFTAIVYPRLSPRPFAVVEQILLSCAFALILYQCSDTGGAESPYMVWWLFTAFYAAHFFPPGRAYVNTAVISALALAPVVYDSSVGATDTIVMLTMLMITIWTLSSTILAGRELQRSAERAVRYLALADGLTGVANLRTFERVIEAATKGGQSQFALVVVDMNGLKGANAAFGYGVGDDMLMRLAGLLRHACDGPAQVARIRGEEFAVYLPGAGVSETARWRENFEATVATHNEWVRNRLPQISVTIGSASYPLDGARASQLFDAADRRLLDEKSKLVRPPHEVKVSTIAGAEKLLRHPVAEPERRFGGFVGATQQLGVRWVFGAAVFGGYALSAGEALRYPLGLAAVALYSLALGIACFALRGKRWDRAIARVSDVSSVMLILPIFWTTGGWQSPLQLVVLFPIVYYAQFLRGLQATMRAAGVIGMYTIAYWLGGALGVAVTPVSLAGETLYATILAALLVLTLILQSSQGVTDDAIQRIKESATHDPLTGLRNIHAFREDLQAMVAAASYEPSSTERQTPAGVAGLRSLPALTIADIDDFRGINNRSGHQAGDAVLVAVAERLGRAVGDMAAAYHIECDEFAVLFKVDDEAQAVELTASVGEAVTRNPDAPPRLVEPVRFSFGTAVWRPGTTAAELVDDAARELAKMRADNGVESSRGGAVLL